MAARDVANSYGHHIPYSVLLIPLEWAPAPLQWEPAPPKKRT